MPTVGSEAARAPISCRDRPYQERPADMARLQMRVRDPRIYEVVAPVTVQPEDRITYPAVAFRSSRPLSEPESWT